MARKSNLWKDGEEKFREHTQGGMRERILTKPEFIRIFCPSGYGSLIFRNAPIVNF